MKYSNKLIPSFMMTFMKEEFEKFTKTELELEFIQNGILTSDSYIIDGKTVESSTSNGALYAMYHYISAHYDINFSSFFPTSTNGRILEERKVYQPLTDRRGNVLEVIDDIEYIRELISWMGYNGANELFFTFFLWDKVKHQISNDLKLRGIKVTLGGHSLKYLMNKESIDPQSFSFLNNKTLIDEIVRIVNEHEIIQRISLWPEDVGIGDGKGDKFYEDYLQFTNTLQSALPNLEVEHIIYNAGLSWDMLEPPHLINFTAKTNALYAYWGRDYSQSVSSLEANQQRANEALKWWLNHQKKGRKSLTVFEYYSDFFMLSEFYGPMSKVINTDVSWYLEHGVDSIVNLQVPIIKGRYFDSLGDRYDYKHLHNYNNFIFIRSLWGDSLEIIDHEWFVQFEEDHEVVRTLNSKLELLLPQFSKFNVTEFPLRYVDMETRIMDNVLIEIINAIDEALSSKKTEKPWDKDYRVLKEICQFYLK